MKKKIVTILAAALALAVALSGCALPGGKVDKKSTNEKLSIVCTNYPEYDFARQIAGDKADVTMLLKPGAESHTYEPSPEDIKKIQDSDMFVYVGGDSDEWVEDVLDSVDKSKVTVFKLMDQVKTVEEVTVEGMEPEDEDEAGGDEDEPEMDEHVWTSPKNAAMIVKNMAKTMEKLDEKNKATYEKNADAYVEKINKLDGEYREVVKNGKRKEIIVADRFPFRYFCEEYGLKYYAALTAATTPVFTRCLTM